MEKEYGVIILAAGKSSRLGRPKQSLLYKDSTLLNKMVRTAIATNCGPVVVVLGSNAEQFITDCESAITIINENWEQGMASSIQWGLDTLVNKFPSLKGVIISVCDQPYISTEILQQLIDKHRKSNLPIIASEYSGTMGTPSFFHSSIFPELMQLEGDKGAQGILQKNKQRVETIEFPLGKEDIDTAEDYNRLLKTGLK